MLGALLAQLFLVSLYVAIATADLAGWVKLGSLVLLAAFSLVYILLVRQVVESPLSTRVLIVGLLMLLTLPQFAGDRHQRDGAVDLRGGRRRVAVPAMRWRWCSALCWPA